jgi:hypothetical protein
MNNEKDKLNNNKEELDNELNRIMIDDIKKIEDKKKEIIKFFYFSELNIVGCDKKIHQKYCDRMIENNYTLNKITPLGNLDTNRDSYEGTLIYHWKLNI